MDQPSRDRRRTRPGLQYRAPAVVVFFAITVVVSLLGTSSPGLSRDLVLSAESLTAEGLFASHLYHVKGWHLILTIVLMLSAGGILESRWGTPRFLVFYVFTTAGTVAVTLITALIVKEKEPSCGAAGAAIGALVAAGYLYPEYRIGGYAPSAKYLVWVLVFLSGAVLAFLHGSPEKEGVFLLPQVSGAGFAVIFLALDPWFHRLLGRWKASRREERMKQVVAIRHKVEDLLAKISEEGYESLTRDEKSFLREASRHYRTE